jgi:iron complex outermembrane receptor protein
MLLYASYAEGFKGAGYSAIAITNTEDVNQYDAETNKTYEAGLKADWFGNRLRTNLAYYFSDIEGLQQNATVVNDDGSLGFPVQNSGDAEIQGLEFEISAVPVEGLNLFFSGTAFTDGEFKNTREGSAADQAQFLYGVPATTPQTPDYSFNIGFDYSFDFRKKYLGAVTFGMDYYEIDDYVTAATNEFHNTGWDQLNGFISADLGDNFQLKLSGTNLSDNDNLTSGSRALGGFIFLPEPLYLLELTYRM